MLSSHRFCLSSTFPPTKFKFLTQYSILGDFVVNYLKFLIHVIMCKAHAHESKSF